MRTGEHFAAVLIAADFDAGPPVRIDVPAQLFDLSERRLLMSSVSMRQLGLAPDARHFSAVRWSEPASQPSVTHIDLVQHWFEKLRTKVLSGF